MTSAARPFLAVEGLSVEFPTEDGSVHAVDGVSFSVERGKTLAIVGESGSGKSVTAQAIMGLLDRRLSAVTGQAWLEGRDLVAMSDDEVRHERGSSMAMIFQDPMSSLHPFYRIGAQLSEAVLVHQKVSKQEAREQVLDMLNRVGIPDSKTRIDDYPHQLSGGMRQRVMIAMALINSPALLIADEPTTALDVTIQAQILALLADLRQRLGTAILLITHDLGVVAETCDEVAVMYAGRIIERASAAELFARPLHPYTIGLLAARPTPGMRHAGPLRTIPGMVPAPQEFLSGCRFHPRCAYARSTDCVTDLPQLREISSGHFVRCHYAGALDQMQSAPPVALHAQTQAEQKGGSR